MINFIKSPLNKIREINRRYAHPRIQQTRMVKIALLILRIYLFLLVGILIYKFITLLG
jgi:hypothetical protein